jgi:serine/threonine protein kinase
MKIPGYRLHRKLGQGGMAAVYLATQEAFNRKVALKIISNKSFKTDEQAKRFQREAHIIAGLSHPHIVPVYDVGTVGNFQFLAMEYLPSGELSTLIKAGLEPDEAVRILEAIAQALHFAHSKGYIHRDVKPDNILFREDLSPALTDFGIARPKQDDVNMTQVGKVMGTPLYMSPEACQGEAVDHRADLYALGVIFYQMLTRQLPYSGDEPFAIAIKHIQEPIPKLPSTLAHYQPIIDRLMAKDPAARFQSGLELYKALRHLPHDADQAKGETESEKAKPTASTASAFSELRLQEHQAENSSAQSASSRSHSEMFRRLLLLKRYRFIGSMQSHDIQHFGIVFSKLTTELLAWHDTYQKRCAEVILQFNVPEGMRPRVEHAMATLMEDDSPYVFLTKLKLSVQINGQDL